MAARKKRMKQVGTSKDEVAKRRILFVEAYCANGGNVTRAYKAAGFSAASDHIAAASGHNLLKDPEIKAEIERRRAEVVTAAQEKTQLTVEGTLRELARVVHVDPRRFFDAGGRFKQISELDDECAAALASVEVEEIFAGRGEKRELDGYLKKVKFWDKNSAIEKAMKHLGMFEKDNSQKPPAVLMPGVKTVKFEVFKGRGKDIA